MEDEKERIIKFVVAGDLKNATNFIFSVVDPYSVIGREVVILSMRVNILEKKARMGNISFEQENRSRITLALAVLSLVETLYAEDEYKIL